MKKRISMLLALAMLFTLAACGGNNGGNAGTGSGSNPGSQNNAGGSTGGDTAGTDIGIEAAKQIALKEAGGVSIEKAELELEDGVSVYEITIRNGKQEYEIKINAQTGEVLEIDVEAVHS